jgi:1,4-dihydroxy-2-naphthoate octaprenyltransferase
VASLLFEFHEAPWPNASVIISAVVIWSFLVGIRNALFHQVRDYYYDVRGQVETFVVRVGTEKAVFAINNAMIPLEIASICAILGTVTMTAPLMMPAIAVVFTVSLYTMHRKSPRPVFNNQTTAFTHYYGEIVLNRVYETWLPLVTIGFLVHEDCLYTILGLVHMLLFTRHQLLPRRRAMT